MRKLVKTVAAFMVMTLMTGCAVKQNDAETTTETSAASQEDQRVVVTSVAALNILEQLGVDCVVGIPTSSYDIPEMYQDASEIGSAMSPDMELVTQLDPTLIISPVSLQSDLEENYKQAGIDYYFIDLNSVEGMYESITELGERFGVQDAAKEMVGEYDSYMEEYASRNEDKEAPTVLILMGLPGSYVVATENSYVGSLVKLAGGVNVYEGTSDEDFINVNTEDMLEKNPDIILRTSHALPEQVQAMFEEEFATNDTWKHFSAVQNEKVFDLDSELFGMSATLEYQDALASLEEILYE